MFSFDFKLGFPEIDLYRKSYQTFDLIDESQKEQIHSEDNVFQCPTSRKKEIPQNA